METANEITISNPKKTWAKPEIIIIAQGYVEHTKFRTAGHERTFVRSDAVVPGHHSIIFQGINHSVFTPTAVTINDFVS